MNFYCIPLALRWKLMKITSFILLDHKFRNYAKLMYGYTNTEDMYKISNRISFLHT